MERSWFFAVLFAAGCAAQPGERVGLDELNSKSEALVGAPCSSVGGCEAYEICDLILCIPEAGTCPDRGVCRDQTRFYDNDVTDIPDNDATGVSRTVSVDRPASNVARAHVSLNIEHPWRGDLRVALTSPAGTTHVLHDRTGGSANGLTIRQELTESFEGETAVGDWTLTVSDHARRDTGRILSWRIELGYSEPAPDPGEGHRNWATVESPMESDHPYANDEDSTNDLRPFSAGALRSRIIFERIDVERGYDVVQVVNMVTGEVLDTFTGSHDAFTTREYDTGDLGVRLLSDYSVTDWGFALSGVEVFGLGCLHDDDCADGYQCPEELVRCIRYPCFLTCQPDTSEPGGEGDGCMDNGDCGDSLYCASDGFCRAGGTCAAVSDCSAEGNQWIRILCVGYATCEANRCGYQCGRPDLCIDGETRFDGCNNCVCGGGSWACTRRFCPPTAGLGEACPSGTLCEDSLSCDQGRTSGATCGSDHVGTCQPEEGPRICTAEYRPVCACNGQSFSNDCARIGVAPYAAEGECSLAVAIPDRDSNGIEQSIDVFAPSGATRANVTVRLDHSYRGDLVVFVEAPDGSRHNVSNRQGGSADDLEWSSAIDLEGASALGTWTLHVSDRASWDTGVLRFFNVRAY